MAALKGGSTAPGHRAVRAERGGVGPRWLLQKTRGPQADFGLLCQEVREARTIRTRDTGDV